MWELDYKESWVPKNWCFWTMVLEKTLGSLLDCKGIKLFNHKGIQSWIFMGGLILKVKLQYFGHLMRTVSQRPWCWKSLKAGGERDDRGWDDWRASLTRWTWVWESCGSWCWTEKPGMLQAVGSERVGYDWATELNWSNPSIYATMHSH